MSKRLKRELYLLPRGEQRALILLSLLLILSLLLRVTVRLLPDREPEGMEEFEQESRLLMASFAKADSLQKASKDSARQILPKISNHALPSYIPIDINRADSTHLLPLPGIGPVFAGRIIKFRNLLGGFIRVDQLGEVYGISHETLDLIKDKIVIDTSAIRKIQLDNATFRELLRHPYLEYEDVKALVNYRDFAGSIQSHQELMDNNILPDSVLQRVWPYLGL